MTTIDEVAESDVTTVDEVAESDVTANDGLTSDSLLEEEHAVHAVQKSKVNVRRKKRKKSVLFSKAGL